MILLNNLYSYFIVHTYSTQQLVVKLTIYIVYYNSVKFRVKLRTQKMYSDKITISTT